MRILFAKNHLKCPVHKKLLANFYRGFLADQYILYDFDYNDKREYLSEFEWYKSRYINEPFSFLMNNKVVTSEILKHYIKMPDIFAIKNHNFLSSYDEKIKKYEDICDILEERMQLFIKPINAGKGKGVHSLQYINNSFYIDDRFVSKQDLLKFFRKEDNWFISEAVKQHQCLNEIYDKTANTMRIITIRDIHTNRLKIFFAVQRIGTSKTIPVDNASRGALIAKIDLQTGILSEAKSLHSLEFYTHHPDSKAKIKGFVIPKWGHVKEQILQLANKFPYLHFIAWDVLLTDNELCIVEANTSSGVNIIQLWGGQRNGELGAFYKHYRIIKK
jgi:hypothetical protein